ncbi:MAG: TetR/AcrR family transcriptional regulator [Micromonosporaceae bacterium]
MPGQEESARSPQQALRQVQLAGREAIRRARAESRESARRSREELRRVVHEVHEAELTAARADRAADRAPEAGTRTRIQQVALDLFTENGYEATSLREIAERLGVTKAALYYHFKTKDDIIASLVSDRLAQVEELIEWGQGQPSTVETRMEFIRRYSAVLHDGDSLKLMRFFERNQTAMHQHKSGSMMRAQVRRMLDLLCDRETPLADQIRRSMAIFALHSTWFVLADPQIPVDEGRAAALEVALSLVQ